MAKPYLSKTFADPFTLLSVGGASTRFNAGLVHSQRYKTNGHNLSKTGADPI